MGDGYTGGTGNGTGNREGNNRRKPAPAKAPLPKPFKANVMMSVPTMKRKTCAYDLDEGGSIVPRATRKLIVARRSTLVHEVSRQLASSISRHVKSTRTAQRTQKTQGVQSLSPQNAKRCRNLLRARLDKLDGSNDIHRKSLLCCNGRCEYCGKRPSTTVDHFFPLVRGGRPSGYLDDDWNRIPSCKECNSSKGGRTFQEWFNSRSSLRPRGARVQTKFLRYEQAFRRRCMHVTMDIPPWIDWWDDMLNDIDGFLSKLQDSVDDRVNEYIASCTGVTQAPRTRTRTRCSAESSESSESAESAKSAKGLKRESKSDTSNTSKLSESNKLNKGNNSSRMKLHCLRRSPRLNGGLKDLSINNNNDEKTNTKR